MHIVCNREFGFQGAEEEPAYDIYGYMDRSIDSRYRDEFRS